MLSKALLNRNSSKVNMKRMVERFGYKLEKEKGDVIDEFSH